MSKIKSLAKLIILVKPLSLYMLLAILTGYIGHIFASFITILGSYGIIAVTKHEDIKWIVIMMLVAGILRGVLRYVEQASNHFIAFKLLALLRDKVFAKLRKLAPSKLEGKDKGDLINLITSDIELLEVFYAHTISPIIIAVIFGITMIIFIGNYNQYFALYFLFSYIVVGMILPYISNKMINDKAYEYRESNALMSSYFLDSLRGLFEIIQYNNGKKRLNNILKKSLSLANKEGEIKKVAAINTSLTSGIILMLEVGVLYLASYMNSFEISLIASLTLISSFGPFISLANLGHGLQNTIAASQRVFSILEEKPAIDDIEDKRDLAAKELVFNNVHFNYDDKPILVDNNFVIEDKKTTALIGESGSGKSTILKLLMRFYKPNKGNIKINSTDLEDINTNNLRNMESFVSQETYLFNDTIFENIRLAKLDASNKEVIEACKKASIHDFITQLKDGYFTKVGELGDSLSSGERQRIGLARAFLHDGDILLLDEPTANLDSLNEAVILKSLKDTKDKTIVLVSHRKSSVNIADKTLVVKDHKVYG